MRSAKFLFCTVLLILTKFSNAQESGIHFINGLSWQQIITKAKAENKYIFLDCYTTWCLPCKKMDKLVYSLDKTGNVFNEKYLSVKYQMDTTQNDDDEVKKHYPDARIIQQQYNIIGYPSLLFFTPEGKLLYKSEGYMEVADFISLGTEIMQPENNYYVFLDNYRKGDCDTAKLAFMAKRALLLKDSANAFELAKDYIKQINGKNGLTKENIDFLATFTKKPTDQGVRIFKQYADTINKIMDNRGYCQEILHSIIYREFISPQLNYGEKVNWGLLYSNIEKKYGKYYAERVTNAAKLNRARKLKKWDEYAKYLAVFVDKYTYPNILVTESSALGLKDLFLNNYAWEVFKYSNDRDDLSKALSWSSRAISIRPTANWMDTYANILYKMGEDQLAIQWEEIAIKLDSMDKGIADNLKKMKAKQPTWPAL